MQHPIPGPNFVPEYQVAGLPFATASVGTGLLSFPFVTQWVQIQSLSGNAKIAFTEAGLNGSNNFIVSSGSAPSEMYRWKVKELWISGTVQVVAGLTMVPPEKMWNYVHPLASGSINPNANLASFTTFGYNGV